MFCLFAAWGLLFLYKIVSPYCAGKYSPQDPSVSFCPMCGCESVCDEEKFAHRKACKIKYQGEFSQIKAPIRVNNIYVDVYTDVIPGGVCCSAQTDDLVMGHSM